MVGAARKFVFLGWLAAVCCDGAVREEQIRFKSGGITLASTLVIPTTSRTLPAVVLLHGSGSEARNLKMARWFAQQGVGHSRTTSAGWANRRAIIERSRSWISRTTGWLQFKC